MMLKAIWRAGAYPLEHSSAKAAVLQYTWEVAKFT